MSANPCHITTPLPEGTLRLHTCLARESLSALGEMTVSVLATDPNISAERLLGKPVTVSVTLRDQTQRELSGYVTRFTHSGTEGAYCAYQMIVRPWLWLLTRTADCRIFQGQSVPEIVKEVFADHPVAHFEFKLFREYRQWDYCVQYRETDFNFVARLLEHEGIYWYFEHQGGKHTLILVDSASAHDATPGHDTLPFYGSAGQVPPDIDYARQWAVSREIEPGKVVLTDYDFERPSTALKIEHAHSRSYDLSDAEVFDYPGGYTQMADGSQYTENRIEELQAAFEVFQGAANTVGLRVGHTLALTRHPREDQNADYLLTAAAFHIQHSGYEAGSAGAVFRCDFSAIAAAQQYRPARRTPKACVNGPQTAQVVGPAGEEIFTDKYGRVKVQFHWDRRGKKNEKSSCWVSVSHPWAGKNFGMVHIPRIGQEVVVGFLEGDPDRPLIIGRTYNAEQMPPWELPAHATQSGILTRSSKGGAYANANALRFEDKKGAEQVWLHAEKNQDIEVENDETHWVGHDRSKTVDHDENVHIKHDRTEVVDHDETITVHNNRSERVDHNETISIGDHRSEDVGKNETIVIGGHRKEHVAKSESITIGMTKTETVTIAKALNVGAGYAVTVGGAMNTAVGLSQTEQVGLSKNIHVGKLFNITVGDQLKITVGQSSFLMKSNGRIEITGNEIFICGNKKTEIHGADVDINPGPAAPAGPPPAEATGLGPDVDSLAAKSPSLQKDLAELKKEGWVVKEGPAGGGSHADRDKKIITIDSALKSDPKQATQVLAHEVGHAKYPLVDDRSSKAAYLKSTLGDEGAATMNNIKVQREIVKNGGPDIGIAGNSANHAQYNAAYDQFAKDGNAAAARDKIGQIFGNGERVSGPTNPTYNEYYGGWYESVYGAKR